MPILINFVKLEKSSKSASIPVNLPLFYFQIPGYRCTGTGTGTARARKNPLRSDSHEEHLAGVGRVRVQPLGVEARERLDTVHSVAVPLVHEAPDDGNRVEGAEREVHEDSAKDDLTERHSAHPSRTAD